MSLKKTLLLAVLLAAAIAYIQFFQLPKDKAQLDAGFLLGGKRAEALSKVEILRKGERFTLENTAPNAGPAAPTAAEDDLAPANLASWRLAGAKDGELDSGVLNSLFTSLSTLNLGKSLPEEETGSELAVFGLKDQELGLNLQDGAQTIEVKFGKLNAYLSRRYLQLGDKPQIYLVDDALFSAANRPKSEFRNHTPISFVDSDLKRLSISGGDQNQVLESGDDFKWKIVEPGKFRASSTAVSNLTRFLRTLRADEFLEDGKSRLADYGLDKPSLTVKLDFKDPAKQPPLTIAFAPSAKSSAKGQTQEGGAYFSVGERPTIFKANDIEPLKVFVKPVADLRETQPFQFAVDSVAAFEIDHGPQSHFALVKTDDKWTVNGKNGDARAIGEMLHSLSDLTAAGFPTDSRNYGFAEPKLKFTIHLSNNDGTVTAQPRVLVVGDRGEKTPSGAATYYAAADDLAEPFLMSEADFQKLLPRDESLLQEGKPVESSTEGALPSKK